MSKLYSRPMRVALVGSGSIAQRYLSILIEDFKSEVQIISDFQPESLNNIKMLSRLDARDELGKGKNEFDALIIASENINHLSDFEQFSNLSQNVLIEKHLFYKPLNQDEINLLSHFNGNLVISSPLRFHEGYVNLKQLIRNVGRINVVEVRCQSWLPDWRVARDFRKGFWSDVKQGGVLREIVHELDYLVSLFGSLQVLWASSTFSEFLDLDVESGITAILRTSNNVLIDLRLDFSTRAARRHLRVDGDKGSLIWNLLTGTLEFFDGRNSEEYSHSQDLDRNKTFRRQIDSLINPRTWEVLGTSLFEGLQALDLIDEIYNLANHNSFVGDTI